MFVREDRTTGRGSPAHCHMRRNAVLPDSMRPEKTWLPARRKRSRGPWEKNLPHDSRTSTNAGVASAARVHTDDVFFLGPYRHHFGEIGRARRRCRRPAPHPGESLNFW